MIPYRVHTDTAYFIVIQRIMSNFAAVKIARNREFNKQVQIYLISS